MIWFNIIVAVFCLWATMYHDKRENYGWAEFTALLAGVNLGAVVFLL